MTTKARSVVRAAVRSVVEQLEARQLLSLTVDLRLPGGEKVVEITGEGQVIEMELWAAVGGANGDAGDEGLQSVLGSLKSFKGGGVRGDISVWRLESFTGLASSDGGVVDLDGDGDLDVGSTADADAKGFFIARASGMTYDADHADGGVARFKLADVQFRVTKILKGEDGGGADAMVRFVPRRNEAAALWMEDGEVRTVEDQAVIAGAPVVLRRSAIAANNGLFIGLDRDRLVVDGTDGDDVISVRRDPADDAIVQVLSRGQVVRVLDAEDVGKVEVRGWGGNDKIVVEFEKSSGVDAVVSGGAGDDAIKGGGGADTIRGDAGADTLAGGAGDDRVVGGAGGDELEGRGGDDTIVGGQGDDSIDADAGADAVSGGGGADWLQGGTGDDVIAGGGGSDEIAGGGGDDNVRGQTGDDSLAGGTGADTVKGSGGADEITGGTDDDVLRGNQGEDTLTGGQGADDIGGNAGADTLNVEEGVDYTKGSKYDTVNNDKYRNPLKQLDDPEGFKAWLIEQAVKRWQYAFGQLARSVIPGYYHDGIFASGIRTANGPASVDYSTTNTQEADVDEADLVKTDGEYLYLVSQGELVIVDAWPASAMHVVSRTPIDGTLAGVYLAGDTVTVVSRTYAEANDEEEAAMRWRGWRTAQTAITVLDVSDRSDPEVIEETTLDGALGDSRMVDGRLYAVVNNWGNFPGPQFVNRNQPDPNTDDPEVRAAVVVPSRYETEAEYRARLEAMPLEEMLPGYVTKVGDEEHSGQLADFSRFYVPADDEAADYHTNMFSVALIDVTDDARGVVSSTTVAGLNGEIYASAESLYVTATTWDRPSSTWRWWGGERQTDIYKFHLGEDSVSLDASGQVPGWIVNQFALDDEAGILRIATTSNTENGQSNNVFTLADAGDELAIIGGITDLAFSERIYSVRFVGDRGYLVTFRQTDPLFTIDLSDPEDPEVKGILKIPGYSWYLHPIADDLVIGVGRDATETGQVRGVQVSLFDVSDMEDPKRLHSHTFEIEGQWRGGSSSAAESDHHAFSYFPQQQILALPMMIGGYDWNGTGGGPKYGLHVMRVDREDGFTPLGVVEHAGEAPLRSVRIGGALYSIGYDAIRVVELEEPGNVLGTREGVIARAYPYYYGDWMWMPNPEVRFVMPILRGAIVEG